MITLTIDGTQYIAPSPAELRGEGVRVYIRHVRSWTDNFRHIADGYYQRFQAPTPKGGSTFVRVLAPDGIWGEGEARCSRHDVFSKRAGYVLAVLRALGNLEDRRPRPRVQTLNQAAINQVGPALIGDVVFERRNQIAKGWTPTHDMGHTHDEWTWLFARYAAERNYVAVAALAIAAEDARRNREVRDGSNRPTIRDEG